MPTSPVRSTQASQQARRARAAVAALFFMNAVLFANLVPRLPDIKDHLELSNSAFGLAIAAMPAGSLVSGLLAPLFLRWFGSAKVASFGIVMMAVALIGVPLAGSWTVLAAVMAVVGALDALVDVGQNAHGFRVQRVYGRSIINALHGLWSVGAVAGGVLGSVAAGLEVPLTTHLIAVGLAFSVVALVTYRFLLPGHDSSERAPAATPADPGPVRRGVRRLSLRAAVMLAGLGAIAAAGALVEDAGSSWGALYMRNEVGTGAALGGLAFISLSIAMTVGRLTGDRLVDRLGQRAVARLGGVAIAIGMALTVAMPTVAATVVGFALCGLGVATLIPAAMHTADELPGLPDGVGLSAVSWIMRVGFLVAPATVGVLADAFSLRWALLTVVIGGLAVVVLSRLLHPVVHRGEPESAVVSPGSPIAQ